MIRWAKEAGGFRFDVVRVFGSIGFALLIVAAVIVAIVL